ncbi:CDP-alcohol phosphatidyltransferase family protein [soil metagenome]
MSAAYMVDKALRVPKRKLLEPLAKRLNGVSPTTLTALGLGAGLLCAVAALFAQSELAFAFWLVNRLLDGLDGELARVFERQSDLGGYFDIMADLVVYAAVPIGLSYGYGGPGVVLALVVLLSTYYVNAGSWMYLSALLEKRSQGAAAQGEATSVTMPSGLVEGAETVVFYSLFLLFPAALPFLFWTMSALVAVTLAQRLVWARRHL